MKSSHTPPRIAGKVFGDSERASSCLTFDARPVTPEEVRRYRKSYFAEPGARIAHPGLINDLKQIDPLTKHGVSTSGSHHVPDVLANAPATEYQRMQQQRSESTYASLKREPLGRSYSRGHTLPAHMTKPEYAFGISGTFGESAKELLYPSTTLNNKQDDELYKRSHGAVAPGEQKNRQYQWDNAKIDPAKYRFGVKTISLGSDGLGAATCLRPEIDENANKPVVTVKQVEEMRSTYDQLGKPRHVSAAATNLPSDHVFGVKLSKDDETARGCIQGYYTEDEQQPDADLGRPVSYGWHNVTPETRSFGVPSIRSDIPMPSRRSIADCQNYGDDSSSKELLYPEEFASSGIQDSEFAVPRDKTQLRAMFEQIGYKLSDEYFALVWKDTSKSHPNAASLVAFRDALNRFLAAEDMGQSALEEWRQRLESAR
ncbi:hypothetical protein Poli38472_014219 [Pythium oligandrum]|uniref:EFHB C-terminal EF-hand domain-containing protein n=1 Tax=Pythium oligandrum TaxID=41045 RepID=A0A8K1CIL5_PYTOL|nr:hypothetical protein Poli38472_014219 [Pythium oligandrum]|eukprot:TMW64102.1 hypothetical protein Poli38472_014219 [Pythium oligandrum]